MDMTNSMLYELLQKEIQDVKQEQAFMRKDISVMKKDIKHLHSDVSEIKSDQLLFRKDVHLLREEIVEDRKQLQEVYDTRREITVRFTKTWVFASFFIAFASSFLALFFYGL